MTNMGGDAAAEQWIEEGQGVFVYAQVHWQYLFRRLLSCAIQA